MERLYCELQAFPLPEWIIQPGMFQAVVATIRSPGRGWTSAAFTHGLAPWLQFSGTSRPCFAPTDASCPLTQQGQRASRPLMLHCSRELFDRQGIEHVLRSQPCATRLQHSEADLFHVRSVMRVRIDHDLNSVLLG
jgi:hypothetical protein